MTTITGTSKQVGDASTQISTASEELAAGSGEQQAQLSEVATTMEEMSAMIFAHNSEKVPVVSNTIFIVTNQAVRSTGNVIGTQGMAQLNGLSCQIPALFTDESIGEFITAISLKCPLPTYRTKLPPQTSESAILYWSIKAGKIKQLAKYHACKHLTHLGPAALGQYPTYLIMSVAGNLEGA